MNNSKLIAEFINLYYYLSMRDARVFYGHSNKNLADFLL